VCSDTGHGFQWQRLKEGDYNKASRALADAEAILPGPLAESLPWRIARIQVELHRAGAWLLWQIKAAD
jgi:hypothetical protein